MRKVVTAMVALLLLLGGISFARPQVISVGTAPAVGADQVEFRQTTSPALYKELQRPQDKLDNYHVFPTIVYYYDPTEKGQKDEELLIKQALHDPTEKDQKSLNKLALVKAAGFLYNCCKIDEDPEMGGDMGSARIGSSMLLMIRPEPDSRGPVKVLNAVYGPFTDQKQVQNFLRSGRGNPLVSNASITRNIKYVSLNDLDREIKNATMPTIVVHYLKGRLLSDLQLQVAAAMTAPYEGIIQVLAVEEGPRHNPLPQVDVFWAGNPVPLRSTIGFLDPRQMDEFVNQALDQPPSPATAPSGNPDSDDQL